ncbi:hypothetical protein [Prochlorothrix hollandica]|uniref:hypothetical protein n=1 Tax=Prochlorothrix hollandica TaxID=1223 RepID=UPI0033402649
MGKKRDIKQIEAITRLFRMDEIQHSEQLQKVLLPGIFQHLTQSLVGETCTQVHFSHGDELCLDFGPLSPCEHPQLTHLKRGTWGLCTRATPWKLYGDRQLLLDSDAPQTDREIAQAKGFSRDTLQGKTLLNLTLDPETLETSLSFSENHALILYPDLWDEDELQHWVLLMPSAQVLAIGPGYRWACRSVHDRA